MFCKKCGSELSKQANFCNNCGVGQASAGDAIDIPIVKRKITSKKGRKAGILWLALPSAILILIVTLYAVTSFVFGQQSDSDTTNASAIIKVVLSFAGIIATIGTMLAIPMAIINFNKKEYVDGVFDSRSGKGDLSEIPEEIKGWNWGAAAFSWIWGATYGVWIAFLSMIPYLNIIWFVVLGVKGNEWAWKSGKWESVEEFKNSQNKWKPWGMAVILGPVALFIVVFIIGLVIAN